jgi:uncharacterized protein YlzI (FlbEa/FlbD family)
MIALHRFATEDRFHLNPDLVTVVEAHPDTVITLATGVKVIVTETPDEVVELIAQWNAHVNARALRWAGQ